MRTKIILSIALIALISSASASDKILVDGLAPHTIVKDDSKRKQITIVVDSKNPNREECFQIGKYHYLKHFRYQILVNYKVAWNKYTQTYCVMNTEFGAGLEPEPHLAPLYLDESFEMFQELYDDEQAAIKGEQIPKTATIINIEGLPPHAIVKNSEKDKKITIVVDSKKPNREQCAQIAKYHSSKYPLYEVFIAYKVAPHKPASNYCSIQTVYDDNKNGTVELSYTEDLEAELGWLLDDNKAKPKAKRKGNR